MAAITLPDKFTDDLRQLALEDHRSLESVVDEALESYIAERHLEKPLSAHQIERIHLGIAAADRGDLVSAEEVDAFFDDWEREATTR